MMEQLLRRSSMSKLNINVSGPLKLLGSKNYFCIWNSIFFTGLANFTEQFVAIWLVLELSSGSKWALLLGGGITATRLMFCFLSVFSGAIADKVSRKLLVSSMQFVAAMLSLVLVALLLADALELWHLFLIVCLTGISRIFEMPTAQALAGDSVPQQEIPRAMALVNGGRNLSMVLGLLFAGYMFDVFGPAGTFLVIFFFYAIAGISPLFMKIVNPSSMDQGENILKSIGNGFKYVSARQILWAALLVAVLINVTGFTFHQTLLPMFANVVIESNATKASLLMMVFALGAFSGSLIISTFSRNQRQGLMLIIAVIVWHSMMILFSIITTFEMWLIILMVAGFAWATTLIKIQSLLLGQSDPSYRGRIQGLRTLAIYPHALGSLFSGWMAGEIGVASAVAINGVLGIFLIAIVSLIAPQLRRN